MLLPPQLYWNRIFHPTDFSDASDIAFAHALKLATQEHGRLTILHTEQARVQHWSEFPKVRDTLTRWGLLLPSSGREAFTELGLDIEKIAAAHKDTVDAIVHYLQRHPHDLIVLATHQYHGWDRLTHKTVAESIARRSEEMTLFIPEGSRGFVALTNGAVAIKHVLIPVDHQPKPQVALEAAASLTSLLGCSDTRFTVLHIGPSDKFPAITPYSSNHWKWEATLDFGDIEEQILHAAKQGAVDLIVMATQGHHGFLDALRGSTTERIVRYAPCPVLAVPTSARERDTIQ
jgi:nucleotide-binding universal stress UspA family protein